MKKTEGETPPSGIENTGSNNPSLKVKIRISNGKIKTPQSMEKNTHDIDDKSLKIKLKNSESGLQSPKSVVQIPNIFPSVPEISTVHLRKVTQKLENAKKSLSDQVPTERKKPGKPQDILKYVDNKDLFNLRIEIEKSRKILQQFSDALKSQIAKVESLRPIPATPIISSAPSGVLSETKGSAVTNNNNNNNNTCTKQTIAPSTPSSSSVPTTPLSTGGRGKMKRSTTSEYLSKKRERADDDYEEALEGTPGTPSGTRGEDGSSYEEGSEGGEEGGEADPYLYPGDSNEAVDRNGVLPSEPPSPSLASLKGSSGNNAANNNSGGGGGGGANSATGRKAGRPANDPSWRSKPGPQNIKAANVIKKKAGLAQGGEKKKKGRPAIRNKPKPSSEDGGGGGGGGAGGADESEEEAPKIFSPVAKVGFWADMEPYFAPFTKEDLKFVMPKTVEESDRDPAFVIPSKGRHFTEVWEEEDQARAARGTPLPGGFSLTGSNPAQPLVTGLAQSQGSVNDLTSRILCALIESDIVPPHLRPTLGGDLQRPLDENSMEVSPSDSGVGKHSVAVPSSSLNQFDSAFDQRDVSTLAGGPPPEAPVAFDVTPTLQATLEERIKMELRAIGLLDEDFGEGEREDDEICQELRKLQKSLKEKIWQNNLVRSKLYGMLEGIMLKEDQRKREWQQNYQLEKQYSRIIKKTKKRKPSVGATSKAE